MGSVSSVPGRGIDFAFARTYRSQTIYPGPLGWGWDFNYNKRLVEYVQIGSAQGKHAFGYDKNGNMTTSTNPYGHTTTYEYDGYDRLRRVTGPLGNQTVIERLQMGKEMIIRSLNEQEAELRRSEKVVDPLGRCRSPIIHPGINRDELAWIFTEPDGCWRIDSC